MIRANVSRVCAEFFLAPPSENFLAALKSNPLAPCAVDGSWRSGELLQEFHDLFLVPSGAYVFPYESCYQGRRGSHPGPLMGKPASQVQEFYRSAGFDISGDNSELPDHVGLEFSFLHALAEREAAAWRDSDEQQARHLRLLQTEFLNGHVCRWIPALCDEIAAKTTHPYFRAFADWIRSVVEEAKRAEDDCGLAGTGGPQCLLS